MYGALQDHLYRGREHGAARETALRILSAALAAADPGAAVKRHLRLSGGSLLAGGVTYDLDAFERIVVTGAGKAGAAMALAVEEVLGSRIASGLVNVKYGNAAATKVIELAQAGHPVPDSNSVAGTQKMLKLLEKTGERDLVVCLISGGASALLVSPAEGIALGDVQALTEALLSSGAPIREMNCLRKHLDRVKGGRLARAAWPSRVISLILSDVPGDPLDVIASGPTAPDGSTFAEAREILARYGLEGAVPDAITSLLRRGAKGELEESPGGGDPIFGRVQNLVVGGCETAVHAALEEARRCGLNALLLTTFLKGEAREAAKLLASMAREVRRSGRPVAGPACLVAAGETTVTVRGGGKGGRNQELALAAALELEDLGNVVFVAGATDGTDGPTDAAGGIVDSGTVRRGRALGLDARAYLERNDSYRYLEGVGDLLVTGPTNTNVNDLVIALVL